MFFGKLLWLVLSLFSANGVFCDFLSFYFENEDDKISSDLKIEAVQDEILDLLGLPEPDLQQNWTKYSLSETAPNFLLKMYQKISITDENLPLRKKRYADFDDGDMLISPFDDLELHDSDNVMTFMSSNNSFFDDPLFINKQDQLVWFNTSQVPKDVRLMAAQLKVYKRKGRQTDKHYDISVYTIRNVNEKELGLYLESSVRVSSDYEGWLQFNVTEALIRWLSGERINEGFYLEVNILGELAKKKWRTNSEFNGFTRDQTRKPFMVGYFKNNKRATGSRPKTRKFLRKRRQGETDTEQHEEIRNQRRCQKYSFAVDFKKLNWLSWIVAPDKFESYYCSGDCSFPLNELNTTNHAIIQTLAHLKNPDLPKPCCAPTALQSIAIIYHVSKEVVNMKTYNNMVVESCGCV